ncbi:unnamed protein product [Miscanthus lutarioriparius]|uniref:Uncharacterized protein n=1 Tax=Miscanthus lutarioriparius TaxID=422564 RepID=A0A811P8C3_9POAL|nr:unnamed protein product [Miscanthus lutarioriparius]
MGKKPRVLLQLSASFSASSTSWLSDSSPASKPHHLTGAGHPWETRIIISQPGCNTVLLYLIGANMQALQSLTYGMKGGSKAVSAMISAHSEMEPIKEINVMTEFWKHSTQLDMMAIILRPC